MRHSSASPQALHASRCILVEDRAAPDITERMLREFEPYIARNAASIAHDYPAVTEDMVQEARITLWQLDLGRFAQRDLCYLERLLCNRMIDVYQSECRSGLTSSRSKQAAA